MTDLLLVRTIITDLPVYAVSSEAGDGHATEFLTTNSPIVPGSAKVYISRELQTDTYTLDENLGLLVCNNPPANLASVEISYQHTLLSDDAINAILALYDDPRMAAADCLDIIASSEALILKRIKNLDLEVDGPAVAKALRDHAKTLRDSSGSSFEIAERIYDTQGFSEKVMKDLLREI